MKWLFVHTAWAQSPHSTAYLPRAQQAFTCQKSFSGFLLAEMYRPVNRIVELGTLNKTSSVTEHEEAQTEGIQPRPSSLCCHCTEKTSSLSGLSPASCGKKWGGKKEGKFAGKCISSRSTSLELKICTKNSELFAFEPHSTVSAVPPNVTTIHCGAVQSCIGHRRAYRRL